MILVGGRYESEEGALKAGERWRGFLEVGFAASNLGADFGDFAPSGGLTTYGASMFSEQLSRPALTDTHGLMAFVCEPRPVFFSATANVTVGRSGDHVLTNIRNACAAGASLGAEKRTAYHLFSSSVTMPSPDARFLTLMTAIETLIAPAPRPDATRALVATFMEQTRNSDLPLPERQSILGSLQWLMDQSISQAGRSLVASLGVRKYGQKTPARFFTDCYGLRSRLVHGSVPRPTFTEVNGVVGELELLARDLLVVGAIEPAA